MPYRGRRGKSRGCFALDKEGITLCNKKKRKEKRKTGNREKRKIVREKGINSMYKEKRKLFVEKKREDEERKNK